MFCNRISTSVIAIFGVIAMPELAQAQIPVTFDSIAGMPWDSLVMEDAMRLYPEYPRVIDGPPTRAYLMGGPCISIPGPTYVDYPETGVCLIFSSPDTTGRQVLKSVSASKRGAIALRNGVDVGDEITAKDNSDGSLPKQAVLYGRKYVHMFDQGISYYCTPSSYVKARKGRPVKVKYIMSESIFS